MFSRYLLFPLYPARLPPCEQSLDKTGQVSSVWEVHNIKQHCVLGTGPALTEERLCLLSLGPRPALTRPCPLPSHVPATAHKVVMTGLQSPFHRGFSQLSTWDEVTP